MRVCREYGWGSSALEAGQMGDAFTFLAMVWRVLDVLDDGVIEGTQKEGKVVLAALRVVSNVKSIDPGKTYFLVIDGFPSLHPILLSNPK